MHITLESDYALRIIYCLAKSGERMDAGSISEEIEVTLRFAFKILRKLVASGLVKSFRGTQGGYMLAKSPEEISVGEVIEVIEGPIVLSRCISDENFCQREQQSPCCFYSVFTELTVMMKDKLYEVKFDGFLS